MKKSPSLITPALHETIVRALNIALDRHDAKKSFRVFDCKVAEFQMALYAYERAEIPAQEVYLAGIEVIVMACRIITEGSGEFPRYMKYRQTAAGRELR